MCAGTPLTGVAIRPRRRDCGIVSAPFAQLRAYPGGVSERSRRHFQDSAGACLADPWGSESTGVLASVFLLLCIVISRRVVRSALFEIPPWRECFRSAPSTSPRRWLSSARLGRVAAVVRHREPDPVRFLRHDFLPRSEGTDRGSTDFHQASFMPSVFCTSSPLAFTAGFHAAGRLPG
jgi:hypothetical protein